MQQTQTARTGFQDQITSGLAGAQGRSDQAFNAALGGYNKFLGQQNQFANQAIGAGNQSAQNILGLAGPGNPWAGQLGQMIRARGNSILPAMYDRIRSEQGRLQNLQGGYNPGYTAQLSKIARDQARGMSENVLNTEVELGERSAAAQAAQAAFAMQQQMNAGRARQGGFGSASGFGRNSLAALSGLRGLRTDVPGEVAMYLQGGLGNLGGMTQGAMGQYGMGQNQGGGTANNIMKGAAVAAPIIIAI